MKKIHISLLVLMLACLTAFAQQPAPEPDTLTDVKQTDPEIKSPPKGNTQYKEDHQKITVKQLPEAVVEGVKREKEFSGWDNAKVYRSKTGSEYVVEIIRNDTTHTLTFDKTGKRLKE
jgi:hypothetical protein